MAEGNAVASVLAAGGGGEEVTVDAERIPAIACDEVIDDDASAVEEEMQAIDAEGGDEAEETEGLWHGESETPPLVEVDVKNEEEVLVISLDGDAEVPLEGIQVVADAEEEDGEASVVEAEEVLVVTLDGKNEAPVQVSPVVAAAEVMIGDGEASVVEAEEVPVIALDGKDEAPVQSVAVATVVEVNGEVSVPGGVGGAKVIAGAEAEGNAVEGGETVLVVEALQAISIVEKVPRAKRARWLGHYSSTQSILVVGDGDFSFSRALATAFSSGKNLVATSLDSYETLIYKYCEAEFNVMELERMRTTVLHGVDATTMKHHADLKTRLFDQIVFNFPHAGFYAKEYDDLMIYMHKKLVRGFFQNAVHLLHPHGEIHVSHKIGFPYDEWDIEQLASESFLVMVEKVHFLKEDYPGYHQKRGDGEKCDKPFPLGACCTFKFRI